MNIDGNFVPLLYIDTHTLSPHMYRFVQPTVYDTSEYSDSHLGLFEQVGTWDFPIFELEEKAGGHVLSQVYPSLLCTYENHHFSNKTNYYSLADNHIH